MSKKLSTSNNVNVANINSRVSNFNLEDLELFVSERNKINGGKELSNPDVSQNGEEHKMETERDTSCKLLKKSAPRILNAGSIENVLHKPKYDEISTTSNHKHSKKLGKDKKNMKKDAHYVNNNDHQESMVSHDAQEIKPHTLNLEIAHSGHNNADEHNLLISAKQETEAAFAAENINIPKKKKKKKAKKQCTKTQEEDQEEHEFLEKVKQMEQENKLAAQEMFKGLTNKRSELEDKYQSLINKAESLSSNIDKTSNKHHGTRTTHEDIKNKYIHLHSEIQKLYRDVSSFKTDFDKNFSHFTVSKDLYIELTKAKILYNKMLILSNLQSVPKLLRLALTCSKLYETAVEKFTSFIENEAMEFNSNGNLILGAKSKNADIKKYTIKDFEEKLDTFSLLMIKTQYLYLHTFIEQKQDILTKNDKLSLSQALKQSLEPFLNDLHKIQKIYEITSFEDWKVEENKVITMINRILEQFPVKIHDMSSGLRVVNKLMCSIAKFEHNSILKSSEKNSYKDYSYLTRDANKQIEEQPLQNKHIQILKKFPELCKEIEYFEELHKQIECTKQSLIDTQKAESQVMKNRGELRYLSKELDIVFNQLMCKLNNLRKTDESNKCLTDQANKQIIAILNQVQNKFMGAYTKFNNQELAENSTENDHGFDSPQLESTPFGESNDHYDNSVMKS